MRIERVNNQLQELGDFGLELLFGHKVLFIIAKNGSDKVPRPEPHCRKTTETRSIDKSVPLVLWLHDFRSKYHLHPRAKPSSVAFSVQPIVSVGRRQSSAEQLRRGFSSSPACSRSQVLVHGAWFLWIRREGSVRFVDAQFPDQSLRASLLYSREQHNKLLA